MSLGILLLFFTVPLAVAALPSWRHSRQWGFFPSGVIGAIVFIVLLLGLLGRV